MAQHQFGEGFLYRVTIPSETFGRVSIAVAHASMAEVRTLTGRALWRFVRIERRRRRRKLRLMERLEQRGRRFLRHLDQDAADVAARNGELPG